MSSTTAVSVTSAAAALQVSGQAQYTDDVPLPPNTLHAAFVTSSRPHAKLLKVILCSSFVTSLTPDFVLKPHVVLVTVGDFLAKLTLSMCAAAAAWQLTICQGSTLILGASLGACFHLDVYPLSSSCHERVLLPLKSLHRLTHQQR
jgi:hypothetical protein